MKNRRITLIARLVVLACSGLSIEARAVTPAPDGCYSLFTTAEGCNALEFLTTGVGNTAVGWYSLSNTDSNSFNTGLGAGALCLNIGDANTAVGTAAMLNNFSGFENVANGYQALLYNTTGSYNNALGAFALYFNVDGNSNTAVGWQALYYNDNNCGNNDCGSFNTATGGFALFSNVSGARNTAIGYSALTLLKSANP